MQRTLNMTDKDPDFQLRSGFHFRTSSASSRFRNCWTTSSIISGPALDPSWCQAYKTFFFSVTDELSLESLYSLTADKARSLPKLRRERSDLTWKYWNKRAWDQSYCLFGLVDVIGDKQIYNIDTRFLLDKSSWISSARRRFFRTRSGTNGQWRIKRGTVSSPSTLSPSKVWLRRLKRLWSTSPTFGVQKLCLLRYETISYQVTIYLSFECLSQPYPVPFDSKESCFRWT